MRANRAWTSNSTTGRLPRTTTAVYDSPRLWRRRASLGSISRWIAVHRFMEPALALSRDESPRVRATVAKLMGALGGNPGVETLVSLLEDREPQVRAAAARAIGELGHWPSAGTLATLLRDPSWEARREAGVTCSELLHGISCSLSFSRALRWSLETCIWDIPSRSAICV